MGLATGVRRNTSRRADKPWAPANRLRHRETMADGLSGTALRHESINRLQSIDSKSRQHSQQQPVASVAARNGQRVFARCAKPTEQPRSKLRQAAVAVSRALQALGKTALGVSSCCDACHASPVSAQLAAEAVFFATAKRQCSVHPNLIPARYLFDTCLIPGSHPEEAGFKSGPHRLSPIKFLIAKNPLPCRRSTRPNAPVGTVPAVRYRRACNLLLRFPGEQLALGASKITV
jgi:hypothetical protein